MSVLFTEVPAQELLDDEGFHLRKREAVRTLAEWLLRDKAATPNDLLNFVNKRVHFPTRSEISTKAQPVLKKLSQVVNWSCPDTFRMKPLNSLSCLTYWRVTVEILRFLSQDQRRQIKTWRYERAEQKPALGMVPAGAEGGIPGPEFEWGGFRMDSPEVKVPKSDRSPVTVTFKPESEERKVRFENLDLNNTEKGFVMINGVTHQKVGVVVSSLQQLIEEGIHRFQLTGTVRVYRWEDMVEIVSTKYLMKLPEDTVVTVTDHEEYPRV